MSHRRPALVAATLAGLLPMLAACSSVQPGIDPRRSTVEAVAPPTTACTPDRPYFEFQVEAPARWLPDSASRLPGALVPGAPMRGDTLSVQFVVDTAGRAEMGSFKVLRVQREAFADSVRQLVAEWRWSPARLGSCRVRQLVQTGVVRAR